MGKTDKLSSIYFYFKEKKQTNSKIKNPTYSNNKTDEVYIGESNEFVV